MRYQSQVIILQTKMEVNLNNFKLLHNHLMSILSTNNYQNEHLPQKIMQYIGMIVESEKHQDIIEDFFDFFCENSGNKIIKLTLEVDPLLSVRILSMLFINLRSDFWISYLLCQPFIVDAIQYQDIPKQQQWPQYYISLLKSLSIRLNNEQLSLFYNKKFAKFPLLYESLKYYNHPDCMVRTNVMNIILGIMKIKDQRLAKYFGRFPFTSYVLTYCCQIKQRILKLNTHLLQVSDKPEMLMDKDFKQKHKSIVKMYYIDIIDYIQYLNDLMELGSDQLAYFVRNSIFVYIVLPTLQYLKPECPSLLICSTLFLMFTMFKCITDQQFKSNLCLLLMAKQLPACILSKISNENLQEQIYVPKVYSQNFNPSKYYWNKFDYQIQKQCVKIFDDVANFQIDHENKQQNAEDAAKFVEQINKISRSLGFNILTYSKYEKTMPICQIGNVLGLRKQSKQEELIIQPKLDQNQMKLGDNPLRQNIFTILENSIENPSKDSTILCIASLFNNFISCETTDNKVLQYCGLLLPRLDTVNYTEQFNKKSIDRIIQITLKFITFINQNMRLFSDDQDTRKDDMTFSIATIRNLIVLFNDSLYKKLQNQQQKCLQLFYKNSLLEMKELIVKKNMKHLVQKFEIQFSKMIHEALFHGLSLPQSVFSPRKSVKEVYSQDSDDPDVNTVNRLYFKDSKDRIKYHIQKFSFAQTFFFKYIQRFELKSNEDAKDIYKQKYNIIYNQKYTKIQQKWKVGQSYQIGFRHMVQCLSQEKKTKTSKKWIMIEDKCNLIIVEPSQQQNSAKILVNHPWKYVQAEIDRQTGKKMSIKLTQCVRGDTKIQAFFDNQPRSAGTLDWMNSLKYERYQSEQAFILNYIKDCLAKL